MNNLTVNVILSGGQYRELSCHVSARTVHRLPARRVAIADQVGSEIR